MTMNNWRLYSKFTLVVALASVSSACQVKVNSGQLTITNTNKHSKTTSKPQNVSRPPAVNPQKITDVSAQNVKNQEQGNLSDASNSASQLSSNSYANQQPLSVNSSSHLNFFEGNHLQSAKQSVPEASTELALIVASLGGAWLLRKRK